LEVEPFRQKYPEAYQKWAEADRVLWSSDSEGQLTTIGHLCTEAMQEFAAALVERYRPPDADANKEHTVARVRAVLHHRKDQLPRTVKPFLDALLAYWGTVGDLAERQEHGSRKEGQPLRWEDARRLVFQTAIVMFELDRSLA
jgi:hypothetical protein